MVSSIRSWAALCLAAMALGTTTAACGSSVDPNGEGGDDAGTDSSIGGGDTSPGGDTGTALDGDKHDTSTADTGGGGDTAPPDDGATCAPPKKTCGARCVDVETDNSNCGGCGIACSDGTVCTSGICKCPASDVICGSACVDLSSDPAHCGGCDKACPSGATCVSGTCAACPASKPTVCGKEPGVCTDTSTDPENCGTCGKTCGAGATCSGGACVCPTGLVSCSTGCADLSSDESNCGGCGKLCATGATCVSGSCTCPASKPTTCGGVCVDTKTDGTNCGGCGISCGSGSCVAGACVCGSGQIKCGTACVDPSSDPMNCGGCGVACAGACTSGTCAVLKCKSAPPSVLFYGPTASAGSVVPEAAYFPSGSTSHIAAETEWRSMTTADFKKYDVIVIGEPSPGGGPMSTDLQAAFDTRMTWGAAINGRIVVLGQDPAYHASLSSGSSPGAAVLLKATLSWLSTGAPKSTSLYVSPDWGTRNLDYLGYFGTWSSTYQAMETITILVPSHPIMIGSTDTTLSNWSNSAHDIIGYPAGFTAIANGEGDVFFDTGAPGPVAVVRDGPTCSP